MYTTSCSAIRVAFVMEGQAHQSSQRPILWDHGRPDPVSLIPWLSPHNLLPFGHPPLLTQDWNVGLHITCSVLKDSGVDLNPETHWLGPHKIKAQENYVISVTQHGENHTTFIYTGDMWSSAPDKLKSHDLQYWQPLVFNDSLSPAMIAPLTWVDNFTLTMGC